MSRTSIDSDELSYDGLFGDVVGALYDAALDGDRWPAALLLASLLFEAARARLVVCRRGPDGGARVLDGWAVETSPSGAGTPEGGVASEPAVAATLALDDALSADLALWRGPQARGLSAREGRACRALLPHLRRALLIHGRLRAGDADAGTSLAALDHLAEGVLFVDAGLRDRDVVGRLQRMLGLTPAESAIALAIAEGQSPKTIARERGVAPSTVRSQLLSVYRKTGLSRQAELTSVVGRVSALSAGNPWNAIRG